jgi:hypothetical protein
MGTGCGAALVAALSSFGQTPPLVPTETATAAETASVAITASTAPSLEATPPPIDLDALPLSEEDLALIEQLGDAPTATAAEPPEAKSSGVLPLERATVIGRDAIAEVVPRTVAEALAAVPSFGDGRRSYLPGDRLGLRGRSSGRVAVLLDGLSLESPLSSVFDAAYASTVDPWLLEGLAVVSGGGLAQAGGAIGSIELYTRSPEPGAAPRSAAAIEARGADRSTGAHAFASGGYGPLAVGLGASYADFDDLHFGSDAGTYLGGYQRQNLLARARLFGDERPARFFAGFDLDRLLNVLRPDLSTAEIRLRDRVRERLRFLGRIELGDQQSSLEVSGAHQSFGLVRTLKQDDQLRSGEDAETIELRLRGQLEATDALLVFAGGTMFLGSAEAGAARGRHDAGGGFAGARLDTAPLDAAVTLRVQHERSLLDGDERSHSVFLTEARVELALIGGLALGGGWLQTSRMPTVGDRLRFRPGTPVAPETSDGFEIGVLFRSPRFDASAIGHLSRVRSALEPTSNGLIVLERLWLGGVEAKLRWQISRPLSLSGAGGWVGSSVEDRAEAASEVPGLGVQVDLRYDIDAYDAYLTITARGGAPLRDLTAYERSRPGDPRDLRYVVLGARAGMDLGAGFGLRLALDNTFDRSALPLGAPVLDRAVSLEVTRRFARAGGDGAQ